MKKKLFTLIAFTLFCGALMSQSVVFVHDGGDDDAGDGLTDATAVKTLSVAYGILELNDGINDTIVICGNLTLLDTFTEPDHTDLVIITQEYDNVDYRGTGGSEKSLIAASKRFVLSGPLKFENMNMGGSVFFLIIANYHPITAGEGIKCTGTFTFANVGTSIALLGGNQASQGTMSATDLNPSITVQSGKFLIVAFNRGTTGIANSYTGTADIDISGGEIANLFGGSSDKTGGNLDLNISGGTFFGSIYASNYPGANHKGTGSNVVITGGDFSTCTGLYGGVVGGTSTIDISEYPEGDAKTALLNLINTIAVDDKAFTTVISVKTPTGNMMLSSEEIFIENPVLDILRIHLPEAAEMNLYTLAGQKVMTSYLEKGTNVVSTNLPQGSYLVQLKFAERNYACKLLIYK